MAGAWSFVSFSIESTTPDRLTDILFANGLMQVPVVISILARYKENGTKHTLSDSELRGVKLVDYFSPNNPLPGEWDITTDENEFDYAMLGRMSETELFATGTAQVGSASDGQNIIF